MGAERELSYSAVLFRSYVIKPIAVPIATQEFTAIWELVIADPRSANTLGDF